MSPDLERLHTAIDRIVAGQPAPVLHDPGLQELLELADLLRRELPADLPDPAFRAELRAQLLPIPPSVVDLSTRQRDRDKRMPAFAVVSAIAAVFLAIVTVGAMAMLVSDRADDEPRAADVDVARAATETSAFSTLAIAMTTTAEALPTGIGGPLNTPGAVTPQPTPEPDDTNTPVPVPTNVPVSPTESDPTATTEATVTVASTEETAVPTQLMTPTATPQRQLANIPPVDSTTVEAGPVPAASDGAGGTTATISFVLATEIPEIQATAPVYMLEPPDDAPDAFTARVGEALGLDARVVAGEYRGKPEYHVGSNDGASFHWYPKVGAFAYSGVSTGADANHDADSIRDVATEWLVDIGYPVDMLSMQDVAVQQLGDVEWLIEFPFALLPQPGYGHPLGVRMILAADGTVTDARGYWLRLAERADVPLVSAADAWDLLKSGKGYWFGSGGAFAEGGELRCESVQMSYILTSADEHLILQPVIAWRGEFVHADGVSSSGVTVFIQATRLVSGYSGP